jgi:hypothetical protein
MAFIAKFTCGWDLRRLRRTFEGPAIHSEDGVSFVHIVSHEAADSRSPLTELSAFKAFTAGVRDRCEEPPIAVELKEIGSYGFFGE